MKIFAPALCAFLFIHLSLNAQDSCLPEGILFNSQEQIDNFRIDHPGCAMIEGDVVISGKAITNLGGLDPVAAIGGDLLLFGNDLLTSLSGLENLTTVAGSVFIGSSAISSGNASLSDLGGLDNISEIGGMLQIAHNGSLQHLHSLRNLDTLGGFLDINNNPSLATLDGLENIRATRLLAIYRNDILHDLSGLSTLRWVDLELFIGQNDALTSLHGLNRIESVAGLVDIWDNPVLKDLKGLDGLTSIGGYLWISENDSLQSLAGLESLVSISGEIALNDNMSLTSLSGLGNIPAGSILAMNIYNNYSLSHCALENICSFLSDPAAQGTFYENATGCSSTKEIAVICGPKYDEKDPGNPVRIQPNPCSCGGILLTFEHMDRPLYLRCFNLYGEEVYRQELTESETEICVCGWSPGLYLAVVYEGGTAVGRAKFVVSR